MTTGHLKTSVETTSKCQWAISNIMTDAETFVS